MEKKIVDINLIVLADAFISIDIINYFAFICEVYV